MSSWAVALKQILPSCGIISLAILSRLCIGLHGYSGHQIPPQYGDYEAQRHWMELTINLPARDWYRETLDNDLTYWGIDYPPLSAYQSWLCGKVIGFLEPASMDLHESRGHETPRSKLWMRLSVLAFDLAVFIPAVLTVLHALRNISKPDSLKSQFLKPSIWALTACLFQPALILIDHGHFQYNNIGLGLTAGAAAAIILDHELLGSLLFCLALNHKQMTLYYAPAFFAYLLGRCLQRKGWKAKVGAFAKLGITVVLSFALLWLPYLRSKERFFGVLQRLAPLRRGLFEDYVANFWCVSSLIIKWKRLFSQQELVKLTTAITCLTLLPSMVNQISRPSRKGFAYSLANSAFAFFIFSYQVHEKSVLLPLMPIILLADEEPFLAFWIPVTATFSMFPLLKKDKLSTAYTGAILLWLAFHGLSPRERKRVQGRRYRWLVIGASVILGIGIHLLSAVFDPPERYPFLFDAMFVSLAFVHFFVAALYLNWKQWYVTDVSLA